MKKSSLANHPLVAVALNIAMLYAAYFLTRVAFFLENYSYYDHVLPMHLVWHFTKAGAYFDTAGICYTNALWLLMVLLPLHWKENAFYHRLCKWLFMVVNAIGLAANLCDVVYFQFTMRRTTSSIFSEFSGDEKLGSIIGTEFVGHWYLVVLFAAIMLALWKFYRTPWKDLSAAHRGNIKLCGDKEKGSLGSHPDNQNGSEPATYTPLGDSKRGFTLQKYYLRTTLSLLVAGFLCWAGIRGGIYDVRPIKISTANQYIVKPLDAALVMNTPFSVIRTLGKDVFQNPHYFATEQEAARYFTPLHTPQPGTAMRRKNVVVIILESFAREYFGSLNRGILPNYKGYTEFLDSLIDHSITFEHSFANGHSSIDAMPSTLSGLPMFVQSYVTTTRAMNRLGGLADCLGSKGYQTAFFHGATASSLGFQGFTKTTGFAQCYSMEDYLDDPRTGGEADYDHWWGIWDEPFLQYFAMKMSDMKQPFLTTLFTLTSHHPFHIPEQYRNIYREEELPIHKTIRYSDNALRRFFQTARQQPWFKNTIFVLTGDHTNASNHDIYRSAIGGFCTSIIIYDPSGELQPGQRKGVAQQSDIMPTLLGYLQYDRPYNAFGCDLLNTPAEKTWAVNYMNGIYQYVKYGYVMQFNGERVVGMFSVADRLMKHNLVGKVKEQARMELELKAIIQQYMMRMVENRLKDTHSPG